MSACLEQNSYKNNQFSKYCASVDKYSQFTPYQFTKWRLIKIFKMWINRNRQRKVLSKLDKRMLKDIGYTYQQVKAESNKPFWK